VSDAAPVLSALALAGCASTLSLLPGRAQQYRIGIAFSPASLSATSGHPGDGYNDMSETARAHILKVMENLAAVEEWRTNQPDPDDLQPSLARLAEVSPVLHPSRRTHPARARAAQSGTQGFGRSGTRAQERIRELEAEIEHLKVYIQEHEAALTRMRKSQPKDQPKRRRGRPPGSKNKPKPVQAAPKKRRGRPPGSKNKPKPAAIGAAI
jgi:hypothetical protein